LDFREQRDLRGEGRSKLTDIGVVKGLIDLQDDFTSKLGLAKAALSNFSEETQQSLIATAGAVGLATAAIGAVTAAVIALGNRGADIADVDATLEHFAGSAEGASEIMEKLRTGTKGTIDNFMLAKDAARLLSAGVKLTAQDFGVLGEAAFVLQNRGLGTTQEMLDLVSNAMVTGRTRALAMATGVVDVGDAEDNFAKSLGTTAEKLSMTGKAEAHRIAVLDILNRAVRDAGQQERDFGEQLDASRVVVENWIDDLAKSIAQSSVFAAGMKEAGVAVMDAFGGDSEDSIKNIVHAVEQAAIVAIDFGIGAVETARIVHVAWSVIKTAVLAVEGAISNVIGLLGSAGLKAAEAAEMMGVGSAETTAMWRGFRDAIEETTAGLVAETQEAAKGVTGHSEFDKTLDKLGGTLFRVKDAMEAAASATDKDSEATRILDTNTKKLAAAHKEVEKSMLDRGKIADELAKIEKKSLEETAKLWAEYASIVVKNTGTARDAAKAEVEQRFNTAVAALEKLDPKYKEHYAALRAVADETLKGLAANWASVSSTSIEGMRQEAEAARETYNQMQTGSLHFTREALDAQLQKTRDLEDAARGMGKSYKDAFDQAAAAAKELADAQAAAAKAEKERKEANMAMGGSFEVTRENFAASARGMGADPGLVENFLKKGYSFQQAMLWSKHPEWPPPPSPGPRVAGFAEGGTIMVGENGPEVVRLPLGSQVLPNGMAASGGDTFNVEINVNGTEREVAGKVSREFMRQLKQRRQFGAA
jgi:hypothetical protein